MRRRPIQHLGPNRRKIHRVRIRRIRWILSPEKWTGECVDLEFVDFCAGFEHLHGRRWGTSGRAERGQRNPPSNSLCRYTFAKREEIRRVEIVDDPVLDGFHRRLAVKVTISEFGMDGV